MTNESIFSTAERYFNKYKHLCKLSSVDKSLAFSEGRRAIFAEFLKEINAIEFEEKEKFDFWDLKNSFFSQVKTNSQKHLLIDYQHELLNKNLFKNYKDTEIFKILTEQFPKNCEFIFSVSSHIEYIIDIDVYKHPNGDVKTRNINSIFELIFFFCLNRNYNTQLYWEEFIDTKKKDCGENYKEILKEKFGNIDIFNFQPVQFIPFSIFSYSGDLYSLTARMQPDDKLYDWDGIYRPAPSEKYYNKLLLSYKAFKN